MCFKKKKLARTHYKLDFGWPRKKFSCSMRSRWNWLSSLHRLADVFLVGLELLTDWISTFEILRFWAILYKSWWRNDTFMSFFAAGGTSWSLTPAVIDGWAPKFVGTLAGVLLACGQNCEAIGKVHWLIGGFIYVTCMASPPMVPAKACACDCLTSVVQSHEGATTAERSSTRSKTPL